MLFGLDKIFVHNSLDLNGSILDVLEEIPFVYALDCLFFLPATLVDWYSTGGATVFDGYYSKKASNFSNTSASFELDLGSLNTSRLLKRAMKIKLAMSFVHLPHKKCLVETEDHCLLPMQYVRRSS